MRLPAHLRIASGDVLLSTVGVDPHSLTRLGWNALRSYGYSGLEGRNGAPGQGATTTTTCGSPSHHPGGCGAGANPGREHDPSGRLVPHPDPADDPMLRRVHRSSAGCSPRPAAVCPVPHTQLSASAPGAATTASPTPAAAQPCHPSCNSSSCSCRGGGCRGGNPTASRFGGATSRSVASLATRAWARTWGLAAAEGVSGRYRALCSAAVDLDGGNREDANGAAGGGGSCEDADGRGAGGSDADGDAASGSGGGGAGAGGSDGVGDTDECSSSTVSGGGGGGGAVLASIQPRVVMVFTCVKCDTRSTKSFSKVSYTKGVVLVRCPGCQKLHLIADHLGWFGEERFVLHEFLAKQGQNVIRITADDPPSGVAGAEAAVGRGAGSIDTGPPGIAAPRGATSVESDAAAEAVESEAPGAAAADPGVTARAAAAAAVATESEGGVFELSSFNQVQVALAAARQVDEGRRRQQQEQQQLRQAPEEDLASRREP